MGLGGAERTLPQSPGPIPQDAATFILHAFAAYDVVGLNAGHNNKALDDFILSLIRRPELPATVNDIVVECGNRRYQPILDRYIAGEDVAVEEARLAWRETSVAMCGLSGFYAELFPLVRQINLSLAPARRFRVVAGDPPLDWSAGDPSAIRAGLDRDASLTSAMVAEVLSKNRKALVLYGVGHLWHSGRSRPTAVSEYERTYPGRTLVIDTHDGFAAFLGLERGRQLEARMASWPIPSVVTLKGSWLADLDLPYFLSPFPKRMAGDSIADLVDGYLYLGPGESLAWEKVPASILDDRAYMSELSQRFNLDVDAIRRRNSVQSLSTPSDRQEALTFAPGAPFVGAYSSAEGEPPMVTVDYQGGQLSVQLPPSRAWVPLTAGSGSSRYVASTPGGTLDLEFQTQGGSIALIMSTSAGPPLRLVRVRGN
jgi:hypothetical protein